MVTLQRTRILALVAATAMALALSSCGDTEGAGPDDDADGGAAQATPVTEGDWLLRFDTAEGADGEDVRAVFVRLDPATGEATVRTLPAVSAANASVQEQALLVSGDHTRALLDTGVPKAQQATGSLVVHRLDGDAAAADTVDLRALTNDPALTPVAAAFDPSGGAVLRVVAKGGAVWTVDLDAGTAKAEQALPRREGFIFGNGFDANTAEPYVESIDSEETIPEGHGVDDVGAVQRQGGTLIRYDGSALPGLPTAPCEFAGGFQFDGGETWLFCADDYRITSHRASQGDSAWQQVGAPSAKVVPATAVDLALVLPPVS